MRGVALATCVAVTLAAAAIACGEPPVPRARPAAASPSSSSDVGACARACATLARCGAAPDCEDRCSHDVAPMREGFAASYAACVDHELATRGCGDRGRAFADERASACYFATLEVYAGRAPATALDGFVQASCAREATCGGASARGADACARALQEQLRAGAAGRVLRALHPDVIAELAACIERAPCDDASATSRCSERARALRAGAPRGMASASTNAPSSASTNVDGGSR